MPNAIAVAIAMIPHSARRAYNHLQKDPLSLLASAAAFWPRELRIFIIGEDGGNAGLSLGRERHYSMERQINLFRTELRGFRRMNNPR